MQDIELYADLIASLSKWAHLEVEALSAEELAWQPDAEGNSIAVTIWHFSRWLDVTARLLQGKSRTEELWLMRGWAERTSYNPQGIGEQGLGAVTGWSPQSRTFALRICLCTWIRCVRFWAHSCAPCRHPQHCSSRYTQDLRAQNNNCCKRSFWEAAGIWAR